MSQDNPTLNSARILLFLFILLIECLPMVVKLMQRPGSYDRILIELEKQEVNSAVDQIHDAERRPGLRDAPTRQFIADEPRTEIFDEDRRAGLAPAGGAVREQELRGRGAARPATTTGPPGRSWRLGAVRARGAER